MSRICIVVLVLVLVCGSLPVIAQDKKESSSDLCITLGLIPIKPPQSVEQKKSPVNFHHSKHFVFNCQECHHTWDLGVKVSGCMTSGCHDLIKTPEKSEKIIAIRYYKKAFHEKCIGCHLKIKKQNLAMEKKASIDAKNINIQKVGPTGCIKCHPKK